MECFLSVDPANLARMEIEPMYPIRRCLSDFDAVDWEPGSFALCEAGRILNRTCQWIAPRHTRIAIQVSARGHREFFPAPIHFIGGLAEDFHEAIQFRAVFRGGGGDAYNAFSSPRTWLT